MTAEQTAFIGRCGVIGRHEGLKIPFWKRSTSSSLVGGIYLGVAKSVSRLLWEQETASSSLVAQTNSYYSQLLSNKAVGLFSSKLGT